MKTLIATFCAAVSTALLAGEAPSVSNVTMTQSADGLITVGYTLANAPAIVTLDIGTGSDEASWQSIGGEQVCRTLPGSDVWKKVTTDGAHTITLRLDRVPSLGKTLKAKVSAWALDDPPDYLVIDICDSASAQGEKEYYPSADFLPGGIVANARYRNTALVLRRIHAKNVEWTMGAATSGNTVKMDSDYYLGVFPMTQGQFDRVAGTNTSFFAAMGDKALRLAENVSYNYLKVFDVQTGKTGSDGVLPFLEPNRVFILSFFGRLRTLTGDAYGFTLPGEAQWEFAARAGHEPGYWGNGAAESKDNVPGRWRGNGGYGPDGKTEPTEATMVADGGTPLAGSFGANDFGLYDMNGGVWEWCLDWYQENISSYHGAVNINASDPLKRLDGTGGSERVLRGGCAGSDWTSCRTTSRLNAAGPRVYRWFGFRVCCPLPAAQ